MERIDILRYGGLFFGGSAVFFGLTIQAVNQYLAGESHMFWLLNALMVGGSFCRGSILYLRHERLLMCIDVYGCFISLVLTAQGFGFLV